MDVYYWASTLSDCPAKPSKAWSEEFSRRFPCFHRTSSEPLDVVIESLGDDLPMNYVDVACLEFARTDLLTALQPSADVYLTCGQLSFESGEPLTQFRVLGSHSSLQIRGGPQSKRHFCQQCGKLSYFPIGEHYLLRSDLTDQPLYFARGSGLVISSDLYAKLSSRSWRKLGFLKLPVLEKPLDGLPVDLQRVTQDDL